MQSRYVYFAIFVVISQFPYHFTSKTSPRSTVIDTITDLKDFKKLLRTKTNILVCFTLQNSNKSSQQNIVKTFKEVAAAVKGLGTLVLIDCSSESQKKLCKKLKVSTSVKGYVLKHYKDGDFNKDYDRLVTVSSMVNFMRDPAGDIPWEEDSSAANVAHIQDANSLAKFLKRESKPILVMFYAPWCGFCKTMKPEYSQAADELLGESVLAAIDVNRPENSIVRTQYNITGFPTLLYYENGILQYAYDGENTRSALVSFMRHPAPPRPSNATKAPSLTTEPDWSEQDNEVVHLTSTNFQPVLKEESSVLVMFYAPWCGHCKRMKPEYEEAAAILKKDGIGGMLAAVDCTAYPTLAAQHNIRGYPTLKYFAYGEERHGDAVEAQQRTAPHLVAFMRNPEERQRTPPATLSGGDDGGGDDMAAWTDDDKGNVVHLDEGTFKGFLRRKKHVLVIFYTPWCSHCKKAKPEFSKAADKFQHDSKVEFAAVDCTSQPGLCTANDIKGYPTIRYFSYYTKVVKNYSGSRTESDFVRFMSDPPSIAPPIQDTPSTSPTKDNNNKWKFNNAVQLTDNNFQSHIDSDRPVLVMFYAPWCGHCRRLKPEFDKAASILTAEGVSGSLAVVDCTENPEVAEKYEIIGFPTIKLFKNGKYVSDYTGKRKQEELKEFMMTAQNLKAKDEL